MLNTQKNAAFRRLEVRNQGIKGCNSDSDGSSGLSDLDVSSKMMLSMSTMGGKNKMFTPARKSKKAILPSSPGEKRISLKTLQPLAGSQSTLIGSNGLMRLCDGSVKKGKRKQCESEDQMCKQNRSKILKTSKPPSAAMIYKDTNKDNKDSKKDNSVKSLAEEAIEMMVNEEVSESYWKELAEERRKALEEALKENEQLHGKVEELKSEVVRLSELAGQTEYFASIIKELMADREDEKPCEDEGSDDETSDDCHAESDEKQDSAETDNSDDECQDSDNDSVVDECKDCEGSSKLNLNKDESDDSTDEEDTVKLNIKQPRFSDSSEPDDNTDNEVESS